MFKSWNQRLPLVMALALIVGLFTACTAAATSATCAFVVGKTSSDTNLHKVIYPGQTVSYNSDSETVSYVPCNSRNYIINDGKTKDANGAVVGDRSTLIVATTSSGVSIHIAARALWTPNQSKDAMTDFYKVCFKYQCSTPQDKSGDANYSSKGWNGMLGENFGPAMDLAARQAAFKVDDSIWKLHDPAQYKQLGDNMPAFFADAVRANLGFPEDLFCGSGNSTWSDETKPGNGTFTCTPVRIIVDDVQLVPNQGELNPQGVLSLNQQRLINAKALYGEEAEFWLGIQDSIDKCKGSSIACVFNIGGTGGGVSVPQPRPNPTPVPLTPTPVRS